MHLSVKIGSRAITVNVAVGSACCRRLYDTGGHCVCFFFVFFFYRHNLSDVAADAALQGHCQSPLSKSCRQVALSTTPVDVQHSWTPCIVGIPHDDSRKVSENDSLLQQPIAAWKATDDKPLSCQVGPVCISTASHWCCCCCWSRASVDVSSWHWTASLQSRLTMPDWKHDQRCAMLPSNSTNVNRINRCDCKLGPPLHSPTDRAITALLFL